MLASKLLLRTAFAAVLALTSVGGTGCATYKSFTQELRMEHALAPKDLERLQFYTSDSITLRREVASGQRRVTEGHKLIVISGKSIEEVVIPAKTPGIVVGVEDGALLVSFEQGTSLRFVAVPQRSDSAHVGFAEGPNPFPGSIGGDLPRNRLADWAGSYALDVGPGGSVRFQGTDFEAVGDTSKAHLEIKSEVLDKKVENKKTLPGVRLPGS
jgi:hypothetical protein